MHLRDDVEVCIWVGDCKGAGDELAVHERQALSTGYEELLDGVFDGLQTTISLMVGELTVGCFIGEVVIEAAFDIVSALHDNRAKVFVAWDNNKLVRGGKKAEEVLLGACEVWWDLTTLEERVEGREEAGDSSTHFKWNVFFRGLPFGANVELFWVEIVVVGSSKKDLGVSIFAEAVSSDLKFTGPS